MSNHPDTKHPGIDLGIDSSSTNPSVAALLGDQVLADQRWTIESTLSQELLERIHNILLNPIVSQHVLSSIAVITGPGGYTGLRTGVATAQGLAFGLDVPLAGVSRLEADAFPYLTSQETSCDQQRNLPVVAVHDLGRGHVAWASYQPGEGAPITLEQPRIDDVESCVRLAPPGAVWCGELSDDLKTARATEPEDTVNNAIPRDHEWRAHSAVRLARLHEAYGDPAAVDVSYLRPPSITVPSPQNE